MISKLREYYEILERMLFWAWTMRYSYDFDAHTNYLVLHHKLRRQYECFRDHGHCVWNDDVNNNRMRKLHEAMMLAKRLHEDHYDMRAFDEADERFRFVMDILSDEKYNRIETRYLDTPERAEMFRKGRAKMYHQQKEYERKRFYYLLEKYTDHFWD